MLDHEPMSSKLPLPKYHQIYLVLREQLQEGHFANGLPGELALMQQFSVARVTVRRALELLQGEGLITREPGRGTRPLAPTEAGQGTHANGVHGNRAQLTGVLTNMILPGTVLAADIDKAIEAGKGKAVLATMGGGTVTATKEEGKTVLTDSAGNKATVTEADQQFSNGVVHRVSAVLMPSKQAGNAPAVGQPAGNTAG